MASLPLPISRFVRKTTLAPSEYRKNFRQIDNEVLAAVSSPEADAITPLMSKIYIRLVNAPDNYWESQGVLRFEADTREGKRLTAWIVLCELLNVSSATANKALTWMHKEGIIGYFSGKNGVGLRIFLNRAASSVGIRPAPGGKKILEFSRASNGEARASQDETPFRDTYGDLEKLEPDKNYRAPKNGADNIQLAKESPDQGSSRSLDKQATAGANKVIASEALGYRMHSLDEIISRLKLELEPALRGAAVKAAAREHERTREWLEKRGIPKAARVAQREAFNVLRGQGVIKDSQRRTQAELMVGKHDHAPYKPKLLTTDEVKEVAEICVSMLEGHGQAINVTLAEISVESGGYLLAEDAPNVRELAESLAHRRNQKG